jgi:hypothetical protein
VRWQRLLLRHPTRLHHRRLHLLPALLLLRPLVVQQRCWVVLEAAVAGAPSRLRAR